MGNSRFPLFIDLTGRRAVVVGGGTVGLRRAEALRRFGAEVTVISPRLAGPLPGAVHLPRAYRDGDLAGAFLAVAATDDGAVNAAAGREARASSSTARTVRRSVISSSPPSARARGWWRGLWGTARTTAELPRPPSGYGKCCRNPPVRTKIDFLYKGNSKKFFF